MGQTYANIVVSPGSRKSSLAIRFKVSTINWLVVLMPVYGERNSLHLVPLPWELEVVEQERSSTAMVIS